MREKGLSAYIIPGSDPHQSEYVADKWKGREWISGFTGSAGDIVITMDHAGLFTDSRYFIQAEQELSDSEFVLHRMGAGVPGFFTWALQQLDAGDKIGLDGQLFSDTQVRSFKKSCAAKGIALDIECDLLDLIWTDRPPLPDGEIFLYRARPSELAPTGYLGRTTIMEFLVMDDALRRGVMRHAGMGELEQLARDAGMRTMYEDGIAKALAGVTTIEEVLRVTEDA